MTMPRLSKTYDYRMRARTYAVQAIYQKLTLREAADNEGSDDATWVQTFIDGRMADTDEETQHFFSMLCRGVDSERTHIEERLLPLFHDNLPLVKMVIVVQAFLLLAGWEWFYGVDTEGKTLPPPQFIRAWLAIADEFCSSKEVSFLNAFFDKMTNGVAQNGTG